MPDTRARMDFMKKLHLFRSLNDEQLKSAAEKMLERTYPEADTVFLQGAPVDYLYLIFQGRVEITRHAKKKTTKVATLIKGDYFGEQGLITGQTRNATVKADKGAVLLLLSRENFRQMLRKIPGMRPNFDIIISSHKLATKMHFKWLTDNEVIYFIARKHRVLLYQSMLIPGLLMLVILAMLVSSLFLPEVGITLAALAGVFFLVDAGWMAWNYIDWGNDFYIVTNQRVIWLEKVAGLYDSRNEASINTILSISSESNKAGRIFDFGTVIVRTFTGQIRMEYVQSPKQASMMIEEYWMRTKDNIRTNEQDGLKQAIRTKLGYPPPAKPAAPPAPKIKRSALLDWWNNAFKMRMEAGGVISYRKHVFVLLQATLIHNVIFLVLIITPIVWILLFGLPPFWVFGIFALAILIDVMLWIYEYMDWSNDLYQLTGEQIIHVEQKPFGDAQRNSAPLENILSSEYKRTGLLGIFFNFGTVYISVGGTQFNFENVIDPPAVQQDIVKRQQARTQKKKETDGAAERDRMIDWLAMYHRTVDEIQREQNQPKPKAE